MAKRKRQDDRIPPIEWITGLAGLVIVAGTLGFIGYEAFVDNSPAPSLEAAVESAAPDGSAYSATVVVRNRSRRAAAGVLVEGVLRTRDGSEARSEARLDYVPGLSSATATLLFPAAPASGGVAVRIVGYTTP